MKNLSHIPLRIACAGLLLLAAPLFAQRPAHYDHRNADLANAMDLFGKAKFGAAQHEFQNVVARIADRHDATRVEAEFYSALCAVLLFNDDAGYRLHAFMDEHPEDLHVPAIRFELFRHAFALHGGQLSLYRQQLGLRYNVIKHEVSVCCKIFGLRFHVE